MKGSGADLGRAKDVFNNSSFLSQEDPDAFKAKLAPVLVGSPLCFIFTLFVIDQRKLRLYVSVSL